MKAVRETIEADEEDDFYFKPRGSSRTKRHIPSPEQRRAGWENWTLYYLEGIRANLYWIQRYIGNPEL